MYNYAKFYERQSRNKKNWSFAYTLPLIDENLCDVIVTSFNVGAKNLLKSFLLASSFSTPQVVSEFQNPEMFRRYSCSVPH